MSISPELIPYVKYITPPVVGAFIGYLTNRVAIRMLFRPLKAWKIAGIRVPMTPGVIPSKRFELAENMGEVVGDHLLTSDEIGKGLQQKVFQKHLYTLIYERIDSFLRKDLGSLAGLIPDKFQVYLVMGSRTVASQLKNELRKFICSKEFGSIVETSLDAQLESILSKDIGELLPGEKREFVYGLVEKNLARMFASETMEEWVEDFVCQKVFAALQQEKTLSQVLPEPLQDLVIENIEKQVPALLTRLAGFVGEPDIRDKVVAGACEGVDKFIESLGSMADMVRGFLNVEMVEEKIREYLDEKEGDIITWFQSEDVQERVVVILRERSREFLDKPLVSWIKAEDEALVNGFCTESSRRIVDLFRDKEVLTMFSSMIKTNIENHLQEGDIRLDELLTTLLGEKELSDGKNWIKREICQLFQKEQTLAAMDAMVDSFIESLLQKPLGNLGAMVPVGVRQGMAQTLQKMASTMLATEVPGLVATLNIKTIVIDKINSLDLLKLEGLLLSIMEEQFKYINLFGALLGFLIGCLNLFVMFGH